MHIWGKVGPRVGSGRLRLFVGNRGSSRVGSAFRRVGSGLRKVTRGQLEMVRQRSLYILNCFISFFTDCPSDAAWYVTPKFTVHSIIIVQTACPMSSYTIHISTVF